MYPAPFDYIVPRTVAETVTILNHSSAAKLLAGGQSLLPLLKQRLITPPLLVDIMRVSDLPRLHEDQKTIHIGSQLTHAEVAASGLIQKSLPLLSAAASWVADRQVRHLGTIGGALIHAASASDERCALKSLEVVIVAQSIAGEREIPGEQFFAVDSQQVLQPHELLTEIRVNKQQPGDGWGYEKLGVRGKHSGWAIVGASAWVHIEDKVITSARLAVSGLNLSASMPGHAAQTLLGTSGSKADVLHAARGAIQDVNIEADTDGSVEYKKHLVQVYAAVALQQAIHRAHQNINT